MKGMVEMGKLSTLVGIAALAGVGFYVGKKLLEKNAAEKEQRERDFDESEVFVEEKHSTPKEKIQKASLFAVGAIKTGTEKFKEGIDEIINKDMVAKGEDTVAKTKEFAKETKDKTVEFAKDAKDKTVSFAKDAGESLKGEIENLKNMVSSINVTAAEQQDVVEAEAAEEPAEDLSAVAEETAEEADSEPVEDEEQVAEEAPVAEEAAEEAPAEKDEIAEAADDIESISLDSVEEESVDTFDFGASERL